MTTEQIVGHEEITLEDVIAVAGAEKDVTLSQEAWQRVKESRKSVERIIASGEPVYGVTTGVGKLKDVVLENDQLEQMQKNLLLSHAAGTGPKLSKEVVRAAMFLRIVSLSGGYSGIQTSTLQLLITMLNEDIVPIVPSQGSVGSSGDLAPLAYIALAMTGTGSCEVEGRTMPAALALKLKGLEPAVLEAKEGLALINGTQIMSAILALCLDRALRLTKLADIAGAMTLDAVLGFPIAFADHLHRLRPHNGQLQSAENIRKLIEGSEMAGTRPHRIQDAYSLRCMPVVHGASRDAIEYVKDTLTIEMNAVTDNPSIFPDSDEGISGGNFHGQPIALASDFLGIASSELGNISERRINRLVDGTYLHLPAFLVKVPGINSGLMIPQYTAAALASENKGLAHPNSVDSITTSAHQEDHNSMGTIAARTADSIVTNVEAILAIELMTAAQALEFSDDLKPGVGVSAARQAIREVIPPWLEDRHMDPDLQKITAFVRTGSLIKHVEEACGSLK